ncbi:MAG: hypothetical protein AB1778_01895 [Candidatus Bipolaricaulota bacterium]
MKMDLLSDLLEKGPIAVNLGLPEFARSLQGQGRDVIHVDWAPRPVLEAELREILEQLL